MDSLQKANQSIKSNNQTDSNYKSLKRELWAREYYVIKNGKVDITRLNLIDQFFRWLGFYRSTHLTNFLKQLNEVSKSQPIEFLERMQKAWNKTQRKGVCPLTISESIKTSPDDERKQNEEDTENQKNDEKSQGGSNSTNTLLKEKNKNHNHNNEIDREKTNKERLNDRREDLKDHLFSSYSSELQRNMNDYEKAIQDNNVERKKECENYFGRILISVNKNVIVELYNIVKTNKTVFPFFHQKDLYSEQKINNICAILEAVSYQEQIEVLLWHTDGFTSIVKQLSPDFLEKLIQNVFTNEKDPWEIFKPIFDLERSSQIEKIVNNFLESEEYDTIAPALDALMKNFMNLHKPGTYDYDRYSLWLKNSLKAISSEKRTLILQDNWIKGEFAPFNFFALNDSSDVASSMVNAMASLFSLLENENFMKYFFFIFENAQTNFLKKNEIQQNCHLVLKKMPSNAFHKLIKGLMESKDSLQKQLPYIDFFKTNEEFETILKKEKDVFIDDKALKEIVSDKKLANQLLSNTFYCDLIVEKGLGNFIQQLFVQKNNPWDILSVLYKSKKHQESILDAIKDVFEKGGDDDILPVFEALVNTHMGEFAKNTNYHSKQNLYIKALSVIPPEKMNKLFQHYYKDEEKWKVMEFFFNESTEGLSATILSIMSSIFSTSDDNNSVKFLNFIYEVKEDLKIDWYRKSNNKIFIKNIPHEKLISWIEGMKESKKIIDVLSILKEEDRNKILQKLIPTLADPAILLSISYTFPGAFTFFSDQQWVDVVSIFSTATDIYKFFEAIVVHTKIDLPLLKNVIGYFSATQWQQIKFNGIIDLIKSADKTNQEKLLISVCCAETLRVLESESNNKEKITAITQIISQLNPLNGHENDQPTNYINQIVPALTNPEHLQQLLLACSIYKDSQARQRLGIALLTKVLEGNEGKEHLARIKAVFKTYWTLDAKLFFTYGAGCLSVVLPKINSKSKLTQIIPDNHNMEKRNEIVKILRTEVKYNDFGTDKLYNIPLEEYDINKAIRDSDLFLIPMDFDLHFKFDPSSQKNYFI